MFRQRTAFKCLSCLLALATLCAAADEEADAPQQKRAGRAVERTRKTVRMLDDIYKTAVVLITDKYVNDEDDFPAGSAAIALFSAVKEKKWHEVRLVDATGEPYNDENVAKDAFEKEAIKQLKAGKDYVDRVERRDGERFLRAATPVPVVLKKCIMCHEHYADAKEGEPIGALLYTIKIE